MHTPIDDADVIHLAHQSRLGKPLRAGLAGLPPEAANAMAQAILQELPEVEAPPVKETKRGSHRRLDGSGYRVFRKQDDDALKALSETFKGFKKAFTGEWKGALVSVGKLGRMLFLMNRYAVEVDHITGAALAQLEDQPAGLTAAEVAGRLPPHWDITAEDVSESLRALLGKTFKDGKAILVSVGDRWTAPNL